MCGIVGYTGHQDAMPIIIRGLKKLEYRGYDSAGICIMQSGSVQIRRRAGKLVNLEQLLREEPLCGSVGIGHTRWATHGKPTENNAHPHKAGSVVVVHNGIIENYLSLRRFLEEKGHQFTSETDTEVISHLIDEQLKLAPSLEEAVRMALQQLRGTYALCIMSETEQDTLIAVRHGSPLVIGHTGTDYFVASDIPAILPNTRSMVFLEDGEMAVFSNNRVSYSTLEGEPLQKSSRTIEWSAQAAEKGGYPHFMLKEIFEQPAAIRNTFIDRLNPGDGDVHFEHLNMDDSELASLDAIRIVACGTSWHAALVGKYLLEQYCRIPVEVDIASEFRYRNPLLTERTLVIPISQSGETADTLAALREGRRKKGRIVTICNVVDSSITREADGVIYTRAGVEIGVASTKAFVTQLVALYLLTVRLGRARGEIDLPEGRKMLASLERLPALIEGILGLNPRIVEIACEFLTARDFLYLGRGQHFPIALEGALKLKEISYIHAEGYPAGEMKHGPIALIDSAMPVVVLVPRDCYYEKVVSNMEEVAARGGRVIALCSEGDREVAAKADFVLELPLVDEALSPIVYAVPLQLLAYHIAVLKGKDVDQPRNLAKSVTVE
jgi:glucosamine--fructose-6-phosphate aminotransferase (isomerizing)